MCRLLQHTYSDICNNTAHWGPGILVANPSLVGGGRGGKPGMFINNPPPRRGDSAEVANLHFLFSWLRGLCWSDFGFEGGKMTVLSSSKKLSSRFFRIMKIRDARQPQSLPIFTNFKNRPILETPGVANIRDTKNSRWQFFRGEQDGHFATFKTKIRPTQPTQWQK